MHLHLRVQVFFDMSFFCIRRLSMLFLKTRNFYFDRIVRLVNHLKIDARDSFCEWKRKIHLFYKSKLQTHSSHRSLHPAVHLHNHPCVNLTICLFYQSANGTILLSQAAIHTSSQRSADSAICPTTYLSNQPSIRLSICSTSNQTVLHLIVHPFVQLSIQSQSSIYFAVHLFNQPCIRRAIDTRSDHSPSTDFLFKIIVIFSS